MSTGHPYNTSVSAEAAPSTESDTCPKTWNQVDSAWSLSLFGTAVGAGVLFLPINAGLSGFWPLLLLTLLIYPTVYCSHHALSKLVLSSKHHASNITEVVEEHFGPTAGRFLTVLYFLTVFPILLIYSVGILNTVDNLLIHHFQHLIIPREILAAGLVGVMLSVMSVGERFVLKVMKILVYPLIGILAFISLYLMPEWNLSAVKVMPHDFSFLSTLWLTIPVLVFAFNYSPAISSFSKSQRERYKDQAHLKTKRILKRTSAMLFVFVMFFVFSIVLTLSPEQLAEAKVQNIDILSYLSNQEDFAYFTVLGTFVAITAILSSFFGHYLGAREGLNSLVMASTRRLGITLCTQRLNKLVLAFMAVSLWAVAVLNPNILKLIESMVGPIIAIFLMLLPVYAINKVPALEHHKGEVRNVFVAIMGFITVSAIAYQLFVMFLR